MIDRLVQRDISTIADSIERLSLLLPKPRQSEGEFSFIANVSQSAFGYPCAAPECRLDKFDSMASFASIYSDQVVLFNPFDDCEFPSGSFDLHSNMKYIMDCAVAISAVLSAIPLIERGIITFNPGIHESYCPECFVKLTSNVSGLDEEIDQLRFFSNYYNQSTDVFLEEIDSEGSFHFHLKGDADLYEHGTMWRVMPEVPKLIRDIEVGSLIDKNVLSRTNFFQNDAEIMLMEHVEKARLTTEIGLKNIFSSPTELSMMRKIFPANARHSNIDCSFPFLASREYRSILKIRDDEWHHFEKFRDRFVEVMAEVDHPQESMAAYRRYVLPEMMKIKSIIEESRDKSGGTLAKNSAISALSITSALATSGISEVVSAGLLALGGGHFAKSMIPALYDRFTNPPDIKNSDFYYAWKISSLK